MAVFQKPVHPHNVGENHDIYRCAKADLACQRTAAAIANDDFRVPVPCNLIKWPLQAGRREYPHKFHVPHLRQKGAKHGDRQAFNPHGGFHHTRTIKDAVSRLKKKKAANCALNCNKGPLRALCTLKINEDSGIRLRNTIQIEKRGGSLQ